MTSNKVSRTLQFNNTLVAEILISQAEKIREKQTAKENNCIFIEDIQFSHQTTIEENVDEHDEQGQVANYT